MYLQYIWMIVSDDFLPSPSLMKLSTWVLCFFHGKSACVFYKFKSGALFLSHLEGYDLKGWELILILHEELK